MRVVLALAGKELRLLFRDKFALFWIFAFPLMFALFFGALYGNSGDGKRGSLSLIVVDDDQSNHSRALLESLAKQAAIHVQKPEIPGAQRLEDVAEQVRKGRAAAYLHVPKGYGAQPYAAFGVATEAAPKLQVGIDPGRRAELGMLQGVLMDASVQAIRARFTNKDLIREDLVSIRGEITKSETLGAGQKAALGLLFGAMDGFVERFDVAELPALGDGLGASPFTVVDVSRDASNQPRSAFDITFPQALVWGLMSVAMTFAIVFVRERASGTLLRLAMAPIHRSQLLVGKALACFAGCVFTMVVLLLFGALALGVRFDSLPMLALGIACTATCFTGLMMFFAVLGKTEAAVAGTTWGVMMPFAMVGGGMIPLVAMPEWLISFSNISPFKWSILAIEGAMWRGFELGDMWLPCLILVGIGCAFFGVGVLMFRRVV